jgi:hypothetical protein
MMGDESRCFGLRFERIWDLGRRNDVLIFDDSRYSQSRVNGSCLGEVDDDCESSETTQNRNRNNSRR